MNQKGSNVITKSTALTSIHNSMLNNPEKIFEGLNGHHTTLENVQNLDRATTAKVRKTTNVCI